MLLTSKPAWNFRGLSRKSRRCSKVVASLIKRDDLLDAIAECQGQKNPNANTCIKLAAYYTILNQMDNAEQEERSIPPMSFAGYSYESRYDSGTEFSDSIANLDMNSVLPVIDELMTTLKALHPRLYNAVIRKLGDL